MILLDKLEIGGDQGRLRSLELWQGDLTDLPASEAVDILVVSSFPGIYTPNTGTLIGALHKKGIDVNELARTKQFDLRATCSCWLSQPVESNQPGIQFKQILCFEPPFWGQPTEIVGDIFRSLVPFVCGNPPKASIAMPLVSSGNVGVPLVDMMEALFQAAVSWLEHGLPIDRLKIFEFSQTKALEMKGAFALLKKHYQKTRKPATRQNYDVFLSYSHENTSAMDYVQRELRRQAPNIRLFVDRSELKPGVVWQQKIHQSLDDARKVLALYSPSYFISKMCQEEFNIARILHRKAEQNILFPIYLNTAPEIPPHASDIQYIDCRESDEVKLTEACTKLIEEL